MGERELFRAALDAPEPPFAVLYVHGPGGVGKTSLLDAFAALAAQTGASPVRIDARDVPAAPDAVLTDLARWVEVPDGDGAIVARGRLVLLVDSYERFDTLDGWLRTGLLPRLPEDAVTVLAGRRPPTPDWRADPAWADLLRVVSLRNWTGEESRDYLRGRGVTGAVGERLARLAHGHPFALALLADVVARGGEPPPDDGIDPALVGTLLRRLLDTVPDARQRDALAVCALARVTTEPLLRAVLNDHDGVESFEWLRGLSFVESRPEGLVPHDLARDVVDLDLRWRDPDGYRRIFRAARTVVHARARAERGRAQLDALFDEKYLFRNLPGILSPVDWSSWGDHHPTSLHAGEHDTVVGMTEAIEGPASAVIVRRWLAAQPEGFRALRRADGSVRGFLALLDLTRASSEDVAADPGAAVAWRHCLAHRPPRAGEIVTQTRFVIDSEAYQGPSPTMNAAPVLTIQRYLTTPRLAWDYLTLAEPDRWAEYFAVADLPRAAGADFTVGGRRFGLFAHDFRCTPVDAWLELVTERALARDFALRPASEPVVLPLAEDEFVDAVRQALRDLDRADLLARNPLLRSRLLVERAGDGEPDAALLAEVLREAARSLARHPRDDKLLRALDRTYLRPAPTQERAAVLLGLPFSTYRRHLTAAVSRVAAWLWDRELYGESVDG